MAQFMGTVQGDRGEASRLGNKKSGMHVHCNGWHSGVKVAAHYDEVMKVDVFRIYATTGSGYGCADGYIGEVVEGKFFPADREEKK